jgi:hypothetical protein
VGNHPNFSWNNNQIALNHKGQQRNSQQVAQPVQESKKSDLESIVRQLVASKEQFLADEKQFRIEQRQTNAKHEQSIQRLEVQVGQWLRS